jgi:hypothetical protein
MSRRITLAQEKSFRSKNLPLSAGLSEIGTSMMQPVMCEYSWLDFPDSGHDAKG